MNFKSLISSIKNNWKAGITVSLVSIPLSVSLAVASQASPVQGIITALWAGLMASIFGGSSFNIVGPTGALSGILAAFALQQGASLLPMLAIISGAMILAAYAFKLERYMTLIPASTMHGFTLGVAFIIAFNQTNFVLGLSGLQVHEKFILNVIESFSHLGAVQIESIVVFVVFLLLHFIIKKFLPKIPGTIILAPVGIMLGAASTFGIIPFKILTLESKFANITPVLFQNITLSISPAILITALTVALVAILETMISARIADGMTGTKHNKRKEMFGLGIANIASGIAGGIPATAALARTSLNIKTGARSKMAAKISSIAIAAISFFLLAYFKYIPLAVIGAILVFVAIQMIEAEHFSRMWKHDRKAFFISIVVALITILEDPIIGILFGAVISLLLYVDKMTKGQYEIVLNSNKEIVGRVSGEELNEVKKKGEILVYSIKGHLDYINGQAHIARFESKLNGHRKIILRLREVYFMDIDGIDALDEIIDLIKKENREIVITGVNALFNNLLKDSEGYTELKKHKKVFAKTTEALKHFGYQFTSK